MSQAIPFHELELINKLGGTPYNEERHELLVDGDWVQGVRNNVMMAHGVQVASRLFLYHHLQADSFVLAYWMIRVGETDSQGLMQELFAMSGPPQDEKYKGERIEGVPSMEDIIERLMPAQDHLRNVIDMLKGEEKGTKDHRRLEAEAQKENVDYMRKKEGKHAGMMASISPFALGDGGDSLGDSVGG